MSKSDLDFDFDFDSGAKLVDGIPGVITTLQDAGKNTLTSPVPAGQPGIFLC